VFGAPGSPAVAGVESAVVAALFMGFGHLIVEAVAPRLSVLHRWALAFPALAAYTVLVVVIHVLAGGRVLGNAWVARGLTLAVAAGLVGLRARRRAARPEPPDGASARRDVMVAGAVVLLALVVWGTPVGRVVPLDPTRGDTPWHMGLASQFLNGERLPAAAVTGSIPNYYPWLYHALVALLARFTPGGRAFDALGPLQLILVAASVLALFAIGTAIAGRRAAGAATALFGGISGGLGFFLLRHLDIVLSPRGASGRRYQGDLLYKRSYNVGFANLSPPFPRDVALVLLMGFLLLLVLGLPDRRLGVLAAASGVLGMTGLAGGEAFLVGFGVAVVMLILPGPGPAGPGRSAGPLRLALSLLGPAVLVAALWFGPMAIDYLRLGGFVNITLVGPVDLTPLAILVSWGVATPFAVYGFARWLPRVWEDSRVRAAFALVAVSAAVLVFSVVVGKTSGGAFLSLSRRHRYWPLLDLGVALLAGLGASDLFERLRAWRRPAALALAGAVAALAVASPVLASLAIPAKLNRGGVLTDTLLGEPGTVLNVMAPRPGMGCVAAVPELMDPLVYSYTGYRLVLYRWHGYKHNLARIRWKDIYRDIPTDAERLVDNQALITGSAGPGRFGQLLAKYGVDVIVTTPQDASRADFRGYRMQSAVSGQQRLVVVWVGSCG